MNSRTKAPRRVARGIGLVEMMIAMLLTSLIVIGIVQAFQSSRQTFRMQEAMAFTQETGTFVVDFLGRDLLRAGTGPDSDARDIAFDWNNTIDGGPGRNDELSVVFDPAVAGNTYCTGEATGGATRASNHYWVNDSRQLMCRGAAFNGAAFVPVGTAQVLADEVESFQVLFGVDTAHAGCPLGTGGEPTLYVPASLVEDAIVRGETACPPALGQAAQKASTVVRTVRVGLLMSTAGRTGAVVAAGQTWPVLDEVVGAPAIDPADGRLRRIFTRTVQLRVAPEVFAP